MRPPYDLQAVGKIKGKNFKVLINNKLGEIRSTGRNDITTYNNLLRLYLALIRTRRLGKGFEIDEKTFLKRVKGEEIFSYAIFILDKGLSDFNFFILEEIAEDFYVNPRNTMLQISYSPNLREKPLGYIETVIKIIDASKRALDKSIEEAQKEKRGLKVLLSKFRKIRRV